MNRLYATVAEVLQDLNPDSGGNEVSILESIRFASDFIDKRPKLGAFIPYTEAKRFDGNGEDRLFIPPILTVTSVVNDDVTLASTDYLLYPRDKHWENGPYSSILHDPDGDYAGAGWTDEKDVLVITGKWGKYDKSAATGATVQNDPQAAGDVTLAVDDGSKISPGMVLLIGTEQELVTGTGAVTAAVTTVTEPIAESDTEITLADATKVFIGEIIRVDLEKMKVLDINTTTKKALVARAYHGTARATHADNSAVDVYRTFSVDRGVNGTTAAAHLKTTTISRYLPPPEINTLCRQIACNIQNLKKSGYAGKSGNVDGNGQEFFYFAFPRDSELQKYEEQFDTGAE